MANPLGSSKKARWQQAAPPIQRLDRAGKGSKEKRFFAVLAAFLALVGVIVAWIVFFPSPPRTADFQAIAISEQEDRDIVPRPWVEQDRTALASLFPHSDTGFQRQEKRGIEQSLKALGAGEK